MTSYQSSPGRLGLNSGDDEAENDGQLDHRLDFLAGGKKMRKENRKRFSADYAAKRV